MAGLEKKSRWIKSKAQEMGFLLVGFAQADFMEEESDRLKEWLNLGYHGSMNYMENHFDKRVDPRKLVEGAKTVISLAYNYHNPDKQSDPEAPKISMYAFGRDYHKVLKKKLKDLVKQIEKEFGEFKYRYFVDSAPVLERDWAKRSGLGWVGKNTLLINPKQGSYFFLTEMIVDFELVYDQPIDDYCGTCTKCIEACPTDAIDEKGYVMDGSKCISYLTIELKDAQFPAEFDGKTDNWMFGCDVCQDVCPWNRFAKPHSEEDFKPKPELLSMTKKDWADLNEDQFDVLFEGSAVKRAGFDGLKRNIGYTQ
jgi:epoxyqueuosine reductase